MVDAEYNYALSERRADSVIQYLASKHSIPAHKIYLIGLGKDKPVESNKTRDGRAKNRRVDVRLMTNSADAAPAQQPAGGRGPAVHVRFLLARISPNSSCSTSPVEQLFFCAQGYEVFSRFLADLGGYRFLSHTLPISLEAN